MDKHSELEIKIEISRELYSSPGKLFSAFSQATGEKDSLVLEFHDGKDDFWKGVGVVRQRTDRSTHEVILTVKKRKSESSTTDRHEVDLPLALSVTSEDVHKFFKLAGWELEFSLYKSSWITHCWYRGVEFCVAAYSVSSKGYYQGDERFFLEIEAEKSNDCTDETAQLALVAFVGEIRAILYLDPPLNRGLYEMYRPKT